MGEGAEQTCACGKLSPDTSIFGRKRYRYRDDTCLFQVQTGSLLRSHHAIRHRSRTYGSLPSLRVSVTAAIMNEVITVSYKLLLKKITNQPA